MEHDPTKAVPVEQDGEATGADTTVDTPITTTHGAYAVAALAALIAGVVIGTVAGPQVPAVVAPYLPIAVVAAIDAVFGGLRAFLDRIFDAKVFVVSFVFNVLVAALIVWLGDQLGVGTQLSTAIVVVLGIRIFGNAAALRRRLFGA
ncbi:small basic family protein [Rhodococcoides fascians]|uniref:small basic family protein n=1 Tax=Rhodococcoides fascians TaxID=1828 RepID=UPI0035304458